MIPALPDAKNGSSREPLRRARIQRNQARG
jgi:hypothetical protein